MEEKISEETSQQNGVKATNLGTLDVTLMKQEQDALHKDPRIRASVCTLKTAVGRPRGPGVEDEAGAVTQRRALADFSTRGSPRSSASCWAPPPAPAPPPRTPARVLTGCRDSGCPLASRVAARPRRGGSTLAS